MNADYEVEVELTDEQHAFCKKQAAKQGISVAEYIKQVTLKDRIMNLNSLQYQSHDLAKKNGFWDGVDLEAVASGKLGTPEVMAISAKIALVHSEISEALEDLRDSSRGVLAYSEGEKPCGLAVEFADAIIRIADLAEAMGLNLEQAIVAKHNYNLTRPYKHGKTL